MRWMNNQVRFGIAAVVVCGGAAWGAHLHQDRPEADLAKAQQIRELAARIRTQEPATAMVLSPSSVRAFRPVLSAREEEPKVRVQPAAPVKVAEATSAASPTSAPAVPAPPVDPVKNIALMGVTQQGDDGRAWLVDLENRTREVVGEGEEAFGFTVKEIDDESVLLARGTETFQLRLGEKSIPSAIPESDATETQSATPGNGFGGPGGDNGRGDRRGRFAAMMAQMSGGGRSWGGRSWGGGSSNWGNRGGGNGGSRWASNQSGRNWGGFSGGFGGGNWGNFNNRNNQNANLNRPTSNPQEARRRKSRLVGGADAIQEPAAFNNPQTLRRLGRSSGQAFGTANNQNRR